MVMLPICENDVRLQNRENPENAYNEVPYYRRNFRNNLPINRVRHRRYVDNPQYQYPKPRTAQEENYSEEEILEFQRILRNYLEGPIGR